MPWCRTRSWSLSTWMLLEVLVRGLWIAVFVLRKLPECSPCRNNIGSRKAYTPYICIYIYIYCKYVTMYVTTTHENNKVFWLQVAWVLVPWVAQTEEPPPPAPVEPPAPKAKASDRSIIIIGCAVFSMWDWSFDGSLFNLFISVYICL